MSACCNKCGVIQSVSNTYQYEMISGKKQIKKTYMSNVCKPCKIDLVKIRYNLAKIHSRPVDSKCMCCGRIDKLHLDHCYNTEKFRGFTCKNCNVGLGHLGDSVEGLERALEYLKKANGRSDEGVAEEAVGGQRVPEHNPLVQTRPTARFERQS
jgi:hypothetical protein